MMGLLMQALPGIFRLGGKLIEDKDKRAEYAFRVQEMAKQIAFKLLDTPTYPWIDGLVKLAYASEQLVKGLLRPLGSLALLLYALMNPEILDRLQAMGGVGDLGLAAIFGAFPGWMTSRFVEKRKKSPPPQDIEDDW